MKILLSATFSLLLALPVLAQEATREEIRRVPAPGSETLEVVVNKLTIPPGATLPFHTHPGDEHAVVITASKAQTPSGKVLVFAIGTPLYFPDGEVHGGLTNVGETDMLAITTSIVRKGEPFSTPAS